MRGERQPTKRMPAIKAVMTPFPYTVDIDDSLARARAMMDEHGIHHLPVSSGGRLVGVISKQDLDTASAADPDSEFSAQSVRGCYTPNPFVVPMSKPLDAVLVEMADRHVQSVLVVKRDRLAGIFTVTDACRGFAHLLRRHHAAPPPDGDDDGGDDQAA
jgi:CBS domain-containing protein